MNPVLYKEEGEPGEQRLAAKSLGIPQESGATHYIESFICLAAAQGEAESFNIQKML